MHTTNLVESPCEIETLKPLVFTEARSSASTAPSDSPTERGSDIRTIDCEGFLGPVSPKQEKTKTILLGVEESDEILQHGRTEILTPPQESFPNNSSDRGDYQDEPGYDGDEEENGEDGKEEESGKEDEGSKEETEKTKPEFTSLTLEVMRRVSQDVEATDLLLAVANESWQRSEAKRLKKLAQESLIRLKAVQTAVVVEYELHQQERPPKPKMEIMLPETRSIAKIERKERVSAPEGYKLCGSIEAGGFGKVYTLRRESDQEEFAYKVDTTTNDTIMEEARILGGLQGNSHIPLVHWVGSLPRRTSVGMILDLLGPSLEVCFKWRKKKFSRKTVRMLGEQMISALGFVHSKNIIHRDVKPENWCMGRFSTPCDLKTVFLVDFGLAVPQSPIIQHADGYNVGTLRWVSLFIHEGWTPTWRDDFESLAYVLLYFTRGSMPWYGISTSAKIPSLRIYTLRRQIKEKKKASPEIFAHNPMSKILLHVRELDGDQRVELEIVRNALAEFCPEEIGYVNDGLYDWDAEWCPKKRGTECLWHAGREAIIIGSLGDKRLIRYKDNGQERIVVAGSDSNEPVEE